MPNELAARRNTRSAVGRNDDLLTAPTPGATSNGRMATESNTAARASLPQIPQRVFYHGKKEELVYRDSSVATSSYSNSIFNTRTIRSSSRPISSDPIDTSGDALGATPERDGQVDNQQSTEPVPADFDFPATFELSPPSQVRQGGPITRNRAKAQALTVSNHTGNNNPVHSNHKPENLGSKIDTDQYQLPSLLTRQHPPIKRARIGARPPSIDGFDGSVEGYNKFNSEGSADPGLEIESSKSDPDEDDDDEYELSGSENSGDSLSSTIIKLMEPTKGGKDKKPSKAVCAPKPKGKRVAKARAAPMGSKTGRPATNTTNISAQNCNVNTNPAIPSPRRYSVSPNNSVLVHQNVKGFRENSDQEAVDFVPDSQDVVEGSQRVVAPLKALSGASKIRRPKKPFYPNDLGGQSKTESITPTISNSNDHRQSTKQKEVAKYSLSNKKKQPGDKAIQDVSENKRTAPGISQSKAKRQRGNNTAKQWAGEGKGSVISDNQVTLTTAEINDSPNIPSSDQDLQFTNGGTEEISLHSSPPHHAEAGTSTRPSDTGFEEQLARKSKAVPITRESFNNLGVSTQAHSLRRGSSSVDFSSIAETKNEAPKINISADESLRQNFHLQEQSRTSMGIGDNLSGRWSLRSPQVHDAGRFSWARPATTRGRGECQQTRKPEHYSPTKALIDSPDTEEPLHPTSRAWAQGIAGRSRQKKLVPEPPAVAGETKPLGRTPQQSRKDPISKREIALGNRRGAVSKSIHEITTTVLEQLKSKETSIDNIVGIYRRSGQKLMNALLDRQSIELRQAVSMFDRKCLRLEKLFEESGRHVRTVERKASNEGNQHLRNWTRRREEIEKMVEMAREAVGSI